MSVPSDNDPLGQGRSAEQLDRNVSIAQVLAISVAALVLTLVIFKFYHGQQILWPPLG